MPGILRADRQLCHLNAGVEIIINCTFPVGGRNVPKSEDIAGGEVRKDVVC